MLLLRTNKFRSIGWWQCPLKITGNRYFQRNVSATFYVCGPFFCHRFFRDVSDRFAIQGHQISRCELHFESFPWATKLHVVGHIWPAGRQSHTPGLQQVLLQGDAIVISRPPDHTITGRLSPSAEKTQIESQSSFAKADSKFDVDPEICDANSGAEQSSQVLDLSNRSSQTSPENLSVAAHSIEKSYREKSSEEKRASFSVRNIMSLPERSSPSQNYLTAPHSRSFNNTSFSSQCQQHVSRNPFLKGNSIDSKLEAITKPLSFTVKQEQSELKIFNQERGKNFLACEIVFILE